MREMRIRCLLLAVLLPLTAQGEWSSELAGGGRVSVDPTTNRATITKDGVTSQAWDGVHRLDDGTTLIIRSGQAIPNEGILRARRPPPPDLTDPAQAWVGTPIAGLSPCERLERRVCGAERGCAEEIACETADQLLAMERAERAGKRRDLMTYSSGQCVEAAKDSEYFRACPD